MTTQLFLDEFTSFLKELVLDRRKTCIVGDFSLHVYVQSDINAKKFLHLCDTHSL